MVERNGLKYKKNKEKGGRRWQCCRPHSLVPRLQGVNHVSRAFSLPHLEGGSWRRHACDRDFCRCGGAGSKQAVHIILVFHA